MSKRGAVVNEETEVWKELRHDKQDRRAAQLVTRTAEILALRNQGYGVQELTPYQFRIDGQLDLFPTRQRFHYLVLDKRGGYRTVPEIVQRFLRRK